MNDEVETKRCFMDKLSERNQSIGKINTSEREHRRLIPFIDLIGPELLTMFFVLIGMTAFEFTKYFLSPKN